MASHVAEIFLLVFVLHQSNARRINSDINFRTSQVTGKIESNANEMNDSFYNVLDYGAIPDGKTDCTEAFQKALTTAGDRKGGIVYVPVGNYMFNKASTISIPKAVSLVGTYRNVPSHSHFNQDYPPNDGSVLMISWGKGQNSGCFINMSKDTTIEGFTIYYPDQVPDKEPQPYPWTLCLKGDNPAVKDVECLNCWNAIYAVGAGRHYIARVQGQPINTGIFIDETYDIGRIEDVHFNPWFSNKKEFLSWQLTHGRSFVFARSDWEYVFNTFSFGYAIGYHFIESKTGACNGNFLGIGADMAVNASVQIDASQKMGILITNGEFTSFLNPAYGSNKADSTQIVVGPYNTGAVQITNTAFWGPSNQIARINGSSVVTFSNSVFTQWNESYPAVKVEGSTGGLIVTGSQFLQEGTHIDLGNTLKKAVITSNVFSGSATIVGKADNTQIGFNADDSPN